MDTIIGFIASHWVEWLFGICLTILTIGYRAILTKLKTENTKNDAIAEGVQALLRESIVSNYNRYQERGYCPIYAKESIKKVYHAYHELLGNDVATGLYHDILKMPTEKPQSKEENNEQSIH